jgi:sensor histidine kinase YesM
LGLEIFVNLASGVLFFYALLFFILPSKTNRVDVLQVIWRLALSLLLCIFLRRAGFLLLAEWIDFKSAVVSNLDFFLVSSVDLFTRFGIYAALIWFFRRQGELQKQILQKELEEERLKRELLQAKHAVLKAQINPHFLFNILNFIHSKAVASDDSVLDRTVLLLSDILRHSLKESQSDTPISVNDELLHIKKLNELNSLRFNSRYYFDIADEGAIHQKRIPTFVLLSFCENAMKYGVVNDPQYPVLLQVKQSPQSLEIRIKNKIGIRDDSPRQEGNAIGTRYVKNILDKYYQNNYILEYDNDGLFYRVDLKINTE